jgi:hypothetical protein
MSAVSEWIVREYFEAHGFLVQQPRKYAVQSRRKRPEEEIDLLVVNLLAEEGPPPADMMWTGPQLRRVHRALVAVRGWHTDRFSPGMVELSPEIFRFAEEGAVKKMASMLGEGPVTKILCLPGLSGSSDLKHKALELLKAKGVDGVLSFPTMLMDLVAMVEVSNNYEKSDLLQILRILKNYHLLRSPQMELFSRRRAAKAAEEPAP